MNNKKIGLSVATLVVCSGLFLASCSRNDEPAPSNNNTNSPPPANTTPGNNTGSTTTGVSFEASIKKIMTDNRCSSCHSYGNYDAARRNANSIYDRINRAQGAAGLMPQGGTRLPQSDIDLVKKWIDEGLNP